MAEVVRGGCVLGVDLHSGSPGSATHKPLYSVASVCEDGVRLWDAVTLARLLRLMWEIKPKAIAVDSVQELAPSMRDLLKMSKLLPPETSLVWVNVDEAGRPRRLAELAKEYGILDRLQKMSSLQTAYALAVLAREGMGRPVLERSEVTRVVVRRARSSGRGGMSSNRYKRRVRSLVKALATKVQDELKRAGLDFEAYYKESSGGLEKALFVVYAPVEKVREAVPVVESQDVVVEVLPHYRLTLSERYPEEPVIVGVDPGVSVGIAVLDLYGRVLHVATLREVGVTDVLEAVRRYGRPVVIATDVRPVPEFVKKLSSCLRARLFSPETGIEAYAKREIALRVSEEQNIEVKDSHSRAALVAAYLAHKELEKNLKEVEDYLRKTGLGVPTKAVWEKVIEGKSVAEAIEEVIDGLLAEGVAEPRSAVQVERKDRGTKGLLSSMERLVLEKQLLLRELEKKEKVIKRLEKEVAERQQRRPEDEDRRAGMLYRSLAYLSSKLRETLERLHSANALIELMERTMHDVSLGRAVLIPSCSVLGKAEALRVSYCYADSLGDARFEDLAMAGVKAVLLLGLLSAEEVSGFVNRGIGVLALEETVAPCRRVSDKQLVCEPKITRMLDEAAKVAKEAYAESERQRIMQLILDYKETRRRHQEQEEGNGNR